MAMQVSQFDRLLRTNDKEVWAVQDALNRARILHAGSIFESPAAEDMHLQDKPPPMKRSRTCYSSSSSARAPPAAAAAAALTPPPAEAELMSRAMTSPSSMAIQSMPKAPPPSCPFVATGNGPITPPPFFPSSSRQSLGPRISLLGLGGDTNPQGGLPFFTSSPAVGGGDDFFAPPSSRHQGFSRFLGGDLLDIPDYLRKIDEDAAAAATAGGGCGLLGPMDEAEDGGPLSFSSTLPIPIPGLPSPAADRFLPSFYGPSFGDSLHSAALESMTSSPTTALTSASVTMGPSSRSSLAGPDNAGLAADMEMVRIWSQTSTSMGGGDVMMVGASQSHHHHHRRRRPNQPPPPPPSLPLRLPALRRMPSCLGKRRADAAAGDLLELGAHVAPAACMTRSLSRDSAKSSVTAAAAASTAAAAAAAAAVAAAAPATVTHPLKERAKIALNRHNANAKAARALQPKPLPLSAGCSVAPGPPPVPILPAVKAELEDVGSTTNNNATTASSSSVAPSAAATTTTTTAAAAVSSAATAATVAAASHKAQIEKTKYERPRRPKLVCKLCTDNPDGFRGEHELRRHTEAKHSTTVRRWVCVDPAAGTTTGTITSSSRDGYYGGMGPAASGPYRGPMPVRPLSTCTKCTSGKKYGADYNAAAHLRRTHFSLKKGGGVGAGGPAGSRNNNNNNDDDENEDDDDNNKKKKKKNSKRAGKKGKAGDGEVKVGGAGAGESFRARKARAETERHGSGAKGGSWWPPMEDLRFFMREVIMHRGAAEEPTHGYGGGGGGVCGDDDDRRMSGVLAGCSDEEGGDREEDEDREDDGDGEDEPPLPGHMLLEMDMDVVGGVDMVGRTAFRDQLGLGLGLGFDNGGGSAQMVSPVGYSYLVPGLLGNNNRLCIQQGFAECFGNGGQGGNINNINNNISSRYGGVMSGLQAPAQDLGSIGDMSFDLMFGSN